ncbi:MAG: hypothetical protein KBD22_02815 [Candidatus Pacebacteria bacterium]|nr:hypothetical protein [Candidatus Paceibacterota bacterium]MBP9770387.1 hypothetical protein [Candidatus Paceibacterota bacterium]
MNYNFFRKVSMGKSKFLFVFSLVLLLGVFAFVQNSAKGANVMNLSAAMSRLADGTATNLELKFTTPTGVSAAGTIIVNFAGFSMPSSSPTGLNFNDIDFADNNVAGSCTTGTFTENTLGTSPSGATWGISTSATAVIITSGTDTVTADRCIRVRLGTNAVTAATGDSQLITGGPATVHTVAVAGTFGDVGTSSIDVIDNDQVVVTATVDPTITFTISDNAIGFGTLTSGGPRYATYDGAGSGSATAAHNLTISTNASSGFSITYSGSTLTSGGNTISVATITNDTNGTPGTEQFAISASSTAAVRATSGYDYSFEVNPDWNFVAGTTTEFASSSNSTSTQFIDMYYLANIAGSTEAGTYTTTLTYIATGNF